MLPHSLSGRLKLLTILWVAAAAGSIILTLVLSWRLEGGAAAINDTGSLRMQAYRLALQANQRNNDAALAQQLAHFEDTLHYIERGDASRPLFLPHTAQVASNMQALQQKWANQIKPELLRHRLSDANLAAFVSHIDQLVREIETTNTRYTAWLRLFQTMLLGMVLIGAVIMVVLLYHWIIHPLKALQQGVADIRKGHFGVQVPLADSQELAQVDDGFNQMSVHLDSLYGHLEQQVAEKTHDLERKNYSLSMLYDVSYFFNQVHATAEAAQGFLEKIMAIVPCDAASIRLIDFKRARMDLIAQQGLPEGLQSAEACQKMDNCLCGQSVQQQDWQPIRFAKNSMEAPARLDADCSYFGFRHLEIFPISYKAEEVGVMALYFAAETQLEAANRELVEALCRQLGMMIVNIRLLDESRQLAVLQERNLIAQGLHDSIAQTLNFLNLQAQMLDTALKEEQDEQARENLDCIQSGIQECYDDVRELLLNFRTKITRQELPEAIASLTERFERQTGVAVQTQWQGEGHALTGEEQLQFIFILQESLSNIRKHAEATHVQIEFLNQEDFTMRIRDNGIGFEPQRERGSSHVGLHIMQERARRIHATLTIDSAPKNGTEITLTLPQQERTLQ